jgi:hypothetical protein
MRYKCVVGFHIGEALINLKVNDVITYDKDYLILSDGRKFFAPLFKSAIKTKWLIPLDETTTVSEIDIDLKIEFGDNTPNLIENKFVWDTKLHWRNKVVLLDTLTKEQLEEVSLLETGKIKDRVDERLKNFAI